MLDWTKLIITVLTSSVVGAVVSSLFSEWQKRNDYKRDYYKKIIDKRMNAYEKLQDYIGYIAISRSIKNLDENESIHDGIKIYDCFYKKENLSEALEETLNIMKYAPWLSDDIVNSLYEINKILYRAIEIINQPSAKNLEYYDLKTNILTNEYWYLNIGQKVYNEMYANITIIKKGLLKDITRLDDVEDFLKKQH